MWFIMTRLGRLIVFIGIVAAISALYNTGIWDSHIAPIIDRIPAQPAPAATPTFKSVGINAPPISAQLVPTQTPTPASRPTPIPGTALQTPTSTPNPATPTPSSSVDLYTDTIEALEYDLSGPSLVVFRVPTGEYDFESTHIVGIDDAATTTDLKIVVDHQGGVSTITISSPHALETPDEDAGVFIGDVNGGLLRGPGAGADNQRTPA